MPDHFPDPMVVATPIGDAQVYEYPAKGKAKATLILGHGAGGGVDARDLQALAHGLPAAGIRVLLAEQPWRVAGKKVAPAPARLDLGWIATLNGLGLAEAALPYFAGGRSAGARVACRGAASLEPAGVLALAFPLHPPGKPEKSRSEELLIPRTPLTVIQGTRDSFGSAGEIGVFVAGLKAAHAERSRIGVHEIDGADHGFRVPARNGLTQQQALDRIVAVAQDFIEGVIA